MIILIEIETKICYMITTNNINNIVYNFMVYEVREFPNQLEMRKYVENNGLIMNDEPED